MVNTSDRPIQVDGVRLDTLAWNITKINRATGSRRSGDTQVPGRDGFIPSLNDDLDAPTFGLEMFVMGTDADGLVPPAGRRDTFRNNLDELIHLFGKRHALLEVIETVKAGTQRRALAKVVDSIQPDGNEVGTSGQFSVGLTLPYAVWEDVATSDWNGTAAASQPVQEVTTLRGGTERTQDAILLVTGPAVNPRITDQATGAYVELQATLTAGQFWRVNVGTWATRRGAGLGLGSNDTTGTDSQDVTRFGGLPSAAAFLPLTPVRDTGERRVKVQLTGTGFTTATRLSIRARRKYAL